MTDAEIYTQAVQDQIQSTVTVSDATVMQDIKTKLEEICA